MANSAQNELDIDFPKSMRFLFEKKRYKIAYGGRGSGKSWSVARALLVLGSNKKIRVLCTREIQKSIQDSVHKLLSDQIDIMGLNGFYIVQNSTIKGINGTEFLFAGLRHNINNLKSYEGVDIVWVEEAQSVSRASWNVLIPTIRKPESEIWVCFNPYLEDDETYQRFVVNPPQESLVKLVNYADNPFFPEVLRKEMEDLKKRSQSEYENVWEGKPKQAIEGAIFADELNKAAVEQRLTRVTPVVGVPIQTFWDLGQSDNTAIWFVQIVGMEYRIIDYYQSSGVKLGHYIEVLQERAYNYGEHCLPHDADHEQLAASATIRQQLQNALRDNPKLGQSVRIVPRIPKKALGIEAARGIFHQCWFDREKTSDGLQCLRHYAYAVDVGTGRVSKEPKHDAFSHGADAFLCFAQHFKKPQATQHKCVMID